MTRSTYERINRQEYNQLPEREQTLLTQQFASDIRKTAAWQIYSGCGIFFSLYGLYKKASISGVFLFLITSTVKLLDYSGADAKVKACLGVLSMILGGVNDPPALLLNLAAGYATTQLSRAILFNDYLALSDDVRADPCCEKMNRLAAATITFEMVGGLAAKGVSDRLKENYTHEQPTREQQKPKVFIKDQQGRLHAAAGSASDAPTQVPEGCTLLTEAELNQVSIRDQQEQFHQVESDEPQSNNPRAPSKPTTLITGSDPAPDLTEIDDEIASLEQANSALDADIMKAKIDYDTKQRQKGAAIAGIKNISQDADKPKNAEDVYAWVTEGENDVNFKPRGNTNGHSRTVRTGGPGTILMGKRQGKLDSYVAPRNQEIEASGDHLQDLLRRQEALKAELRRLRARAADIEPTLPPPDGLTGNTPSNPLPVPDSNTGGQPSGSSAGNDNAKDALLDEVAKIMTDIDKAKQVKNAKKGLDAKKNKAKPKKKRSAGYESWYNGDQLLALLAARTEQNTAVEVHACVDGVTQVSADVDDGEHNVLRNSLRDLIVNRCVLKENDVEALRASPNEWIIPINLGNDPSFNARFENANSADRAQLQAGSHWVLLHIRFAETSETAEAITYIDSLSQRINQDVSQVLSALFPDTDVSNESHTQQQDNFSCGDWCCAAALHLVNGQYQHPRALNQDDVYTMRDAHLLILGQQGLRDRENNPPRSSEHDEQSSGELKARASAAEQKAEQLAAENDHLKQELATQRDRNAADDQQRIEDAVAPAGARRRRRLPQKAAGTVADAAAFFQRHGNAGNDESHDLSKKADNGDQKRFGRNP